MSPTRRRQRTRGLRVLAPILVALAATIAPAPAGAANTAFAAAGRVELAFTPGDAVDMRIAAAIAGAEREVLVLAYSFTNPKIAQALAAAHRRGARVEIVADRGQTLELPQSAVPALARDGVPVWLDGNFGAAHNKVVIIDADAPHAITITGSYNFTLAAQRKNAENVVMLQDNPEVARAFRAYFTRLQTRATRWSGDTVPVGRRSRNAR